MLKARKWWMRFLLGMILSCAGVAVGLGYWVMWGAWPVLDHEHLPWEPDVIVVLGGGNEERPREAMRLATAYQDVPVVVTGDGGMIVEPLLAAGLDSGRLHHEQLATTTMENARFTGPMLDELDAQRVVLVTNWFHVPRSLAAFRREQPQREFFAAFEAKPDPVSKWHVSYLRRERLAVLHHVVRHRVWAF